MVAPSDLALAYATPLAPGTATAMFGADGISRLRPIQRDHRREEDGRSHCIARSGRPSRRVGSILRPNWPLSCRGARHATVTTKVVVANAGMRYDDPWLRAMIMAPSLWDSMTATLYGTPDLSELRTLMRKPSSALTLSFNDDPYPAMSPNRFRGEPVVFLTTHAFTQRTASLR
jgi:hypothetical protein